MVVHLLQEELQKNLSSTQMLEEVEAEVEEADLEAMVEIRICSKLKKTSTTMLNAITVVKWVIWLKTAIKSRMTS